MGITILLFVHKENMHANISHNSIIKLKNYLQHNLQYNTMMEM